MSKGKGFMTIVPRVYGSWRTSSFDLVIDVQKDDPDHGKAVYVEFGSKFLELHPSKARELAAALLEAADKSDQLFEKNQAVRA